MVAVAQKQDTCLVSQICLEKGSVSPTRSMAFQSMFSTEVEEFFLIDKVFKHKGLINPVGDMVGDIFRDYLIVNDAKPVIHTVNVSIMVLMSGFYGGTV